MKEAMEIMPETLEYGIINANVLHLLKNIICQVTVDKGKGPQHFVRLRPLDSFTPQVMNIQQVPPWALVAERRGARTRSLCSRSLFWGKDTKHRFINWKISDIDKWHE